MPGASSQPPLLNQLFGTERRKLDGGTASPAESGHRPVQRFAFRASIERLPTTGTLPNAPLEIDSPITPRIRATHLADGTLGWHLVGCVAWHATYPAPYGRFKRPYDLSTSGTILYTKSNPDSPRQPWVGLRSFQASAGSATPMHRGPWRLGGSHSGAASLCQHSLTFSQAARPLDRLPSPESCSLASGRTSHSSVGWLLALGSL